MDMFSQSRGKQFPHGNGIVTTEGLTEQLVCGNDRGTIFKSNTLDFQTGLKN